MERRSFRHAICIDELEIGEDLLLLITGGEAHIGAVATAYTSTRREAVVETETVCVPGHKEAELADGFAKELAERLGRTVTVVMGIHYDHLSREELKELVSEIRECFHTYLSGKVQKTESSRK